MIKTREIRLADKETVERINREFGNPYSSHAFPSLYLWKEYLKLSIYLERDFYAVKCGLRGRNTWFFPVGEPEAVRGFLEAIQKEPEAGLCYMGEKEKAFLAQHFPGSFACRRDEDSDEYIYDIEEHMQLKGKAYGNVRSQLHRAEGTYSCSVKPLEEASDEELLQVLRGWDNNVRRSGRFSSVEEEYPAIACRRELGLFGILVLKEQEPWGVACGFPLDHETFDLYLAMERTRLPGFAYYVKHLLFRSLRDRYRYVNIEEDLGIPGLRRMKTSLHPVRKNLMWEAWTKGDAS